MIISDAPMVKLQEYQDLYPNATKFHWIIGCKVLCDKDAQLFIESVRIYVRFSFPNNNFMGHNFAVSTAIKVATDWV